MNDLHRDDSQISRFEREGLLRFRARDAVIAAVLVALALVFFAGGAVRDAAEEMDPGIGRDIMVAIGEPTGWVADQLPFAEAAEDLTAGLSPDAELSGGGFEASAAASAQSELPPVTPDYFDPQAIGAEGPPRGSSKRCWSLATRFRLPWISSSPGTTRSSASRSSATLTWRPASPRATCSTGASSPPARSSATSRMRSSSSSEPTRAFRFQTHPVRRSSAAEPTGPPPTPTGPAR